MVHMAREDKVEPKETNRNSKWKRAGGVREGVVSTLATIRRKRRKNGKQNTLRARQRCPNSASADEEDDLHVSHPRFAVRWNLPSALVANYAYRSVFAGTQLFEQLSCSKGPLKYNLSEVLEHNDCCQKSEGKGSEA
ncbi:hypothetical protein QUC31_011378 [Theobroma cacao]